MNDEVQALLVQVAFRDREIIRLEDELAQTRSDLAYIARMLDTAYSWLAQKDNQLYLEERVKDG